MTRWLLAVVVLVLALQGAPRAQSTAFDRVFPSPGLPTAAGRTAADVLSYVPVVVNLGIDAKHSCLDATDKARGCGLLGVRLGSVWLSTYVIKSIVKRQRPCALAYTRTCGIDSANSSFPSAHAAFTWSAFNGTKSIGITIPMGVLVDIGRDIADKHWPTDLLAGDAIGAAISRIR